MSSNDAPTARYTLGEGIAVEYHATGGGSLQLEFEELSALQSRLLNRLSKLLISQER